MKKRKLVFIVFGLLSALVLISCNPEKEVDNDSLRFPGAINGKTFKIEATTRGAGTATNYYYITTNDTKVTVDAYVASQYTSYTEDVSIIINNDVCTAISSNGSTYTFTITSNTLSSVTVDNKTSSTFSGTFSSVTEISTPDGWTYESKKYEGMSVSTHGSMRLMVTPIGVYIAVTYTGKPSVEDDFDWTALKNAEFFSYDKITKTSEGHFDIACGPEDSSYKHTLDIENGGYKVFYETGIGAEQAANFTHHVKEKDFDDSFFFSRF